jgi:hypothetical protein
MMAGEGSTAYTVYILSCAHGVYHTRFCGRSSL